MSENRMDIERFCKALGKIYSERYGLKVTVRAEQKKQKAENTINHSLNGQQVK